MKQLSQAKLDQRFEVINLVNFHPQKRSAWLPVTNKALALLIFIMKFLINNIRAAPLCIILSHCEQGYSNLF